jgi:hypothetical protein
MMLPGLQGRMNGGKRGVNGLMNFPEHATILETPFIAETPLLWIS